MSGPLARTARLVKRLVPGRLLTALLSARSLVGEGPVVTVPVARRVLVLAPHPDDEVLMCGGTIARLADGGSSVRVVVASDGGATKAAPGGTDAIENLRRTEAVAACERLGVTDVHFLAHPDGRLDEVEAALAADIGRHLAEFGPDAVFLPWYLDGHGDHQALNRAFVAAEPKSEIEVWAGEVWTPVPANRIVDITGTMPRKEEALRAHATAAETFDVSALLGINRYRSAHGLLGKGYAEAFLMQSAGRYADLVRGAGYSSAS